MDLDPGRINLQTATCYSNPVSYYTKTTLGVDPWKGEEELTKFVESKFGVGTEAYVNTLMNEVPKILRIQEIFGWLQALPPKKGVCPFASLLPPRI